MGRSGQVSRLTRALYCYCGLFVAIRTRADSSYSMMLAPRRRMVILAETKVYVAKLLANGDPVWK